jgi:hypothetical protein
MGCCGMGNWNNEDQQKDRDEREVSKESIIGVVAGIGIFTTVIYLFM